MDTILSYSPLDNNNSNFQTVNLLHGYKCIKTLLRHQNITFAKSITLEKFEFVWYL